MYILARNVYGPFQQLLRKHCYVTSDRFEIKEQARAVRFSNDGNLDGFCSNFAIVVIASNILEDICMDKLIGLLRNPMLWLLLRTENITNKFRTMARLSIANAACYISVKVRGVATRYQ